MATYSYSGNTSQFDLDHTNIVIAIKVDVTANPVFTKLAETTASANGDFLLQWENWGGRVIVGAVDDDENIQLECKFHDWIIGKNELSYSSLVLADGPLLYYKLDETSGTTAFDSSGNNYHGTYVNGVTPGQATLVNGEPFSAKFDGVSSYVVGPDEPALRIIGDVTIEAWVTPVAASGGTSSRILTCYNSGETEAANYLFDLHYGADRVLTVFHEYGAGSNEIYATPLVFEYGETYHIVAVRDSLQTEWRIYVNGDDIGAISYVNQATGGSTTRVSVGGLWADPGVSPANAYIDEVAIYNKLLPLTSILDHYQMGVHGAITGLTLNNITLNYDPLVYYKLDDVSGTTALDSSGNGYHGTYAGSPALSQTSLFTQGTSVLFDGVNDRIEVPSASTIASTIGAGSFTLRAWFSVDSFGANNQTIFGLNNTSGANEILANVLSLELTPHGEVQFYYVNNSDAATVLTTRRGFIKEATPYDISLVFEAGSGEVRLYLNGREERYVFPDTSYGLTRKGDLSLVNSIFIGDEFDITPANNNWFKGKIDDVKIYAHALSSDDIRTQYMYGINGANHNIDTYRSWWSFDEASGVNVYDNAWHFPSNGYITDGTDLVDGVLRTTGLVGGAIQGDGTHFVRLPHIGNRWNIQHEFTLGCLLYPSGLTVNVPILDLGYLNDDTTASNNDGLILYLTAAGEVRYRVRTETFTGYGTSGANGRWYTGVLVKQDDWNWIFATRGYDFATVWVYNSDGISTATISIPGSPINGWANRRNHIGAYTTNSTETNYTIMTSQAILNYAFVYNRVLTQTEREYIVNGGAGWKPVKQYTEFYGTDMSFETISHIAWKLDSGVPRFDLGSGARIESLGTSRINNFVGGGTADAIMKLHQDIAIPPNTEFVELPYYWLRTSFGDTDHANIRIEFLDASKVFIKHACQDSSLRTDSLNQLTTWYTKEVDHNIAPIPSGAAYVRLIVQSNRGASGTSNNAQIDEIKLDFIPKTGFSFISGNLLQNGGFETGSLTGWTKVSTNGGIVTSSSEYVTEGIFAVNGESVNAINSIEYYQEVNVASYVNDNYLIFSGAQCGAHLGDSSQLRLVGYDISNAVLFDMTAYGGAHDSITYKTYSSFGIKWANYPTLDHVRCYFRLVARSGIGNAGVDDLSLISYGS